MRSSAVVAAFAGVAVAGSTTYTTQYYTITDCPDTATDCPGDYMETTSSVIPMTTSTVYATKVHTVTDCPDTVTDCPFDAPTTVITETEAVSTTVCPVDDEETYMPPVPTFHNITEAYTPPSMETSTYMPPPMETEAPVETETEAPVETETEAPIETESEAPECPASSVKTISTSYTTVIPTVIYETIDMPCPTAEPTLEPPMMTSSMVLTYTNNATATSVIQPPPTFTAGASTLGGSVVLAGVAALAAVLA